MEDKPPISARTMWFYQRFAPAFVIMFVCITLFKKVNYLGAVSKLEWVLFFGLMTMGLSMIWIFDPYHGPAKFWYPNLKTDENGEENE